MLEPHDDAPPRARAGRRSTGSALAGLAVVAVAVVLLVTLLGRGGPGATADPGPTPGQQPPATTDAGPPAAVEVSLELDRDRVVSGQELPATVVLTNTTGQPIALPPNCTGGESVFAGLSGGHVRFTHPSVTVSGCLVELPVVIAPGANRFPTTISTTYQGCIMGTSTDPGEPSCEPGARIPPRLPVGTYRTVVLADDLPPGSTMPAPSTVTITAR